MNIGAGMRLSLAALIASTGAAAVAEEVPLSAFSPSATVINFDNLAGGGTITSGEVISNQYAALGVTFHNPHYLTHANANLAVFFATHSAPNIAFAHQGGGTDPNAGPQEIHFAAPVLRVGMWFGTSPNSTFTIRAYNGSTMLEQIVKSGQPLGAFGLEGFVGIQRTEGITSVRISCASFDPGLHPFNFSFDDLIFDVGTPACYANCDESTVAPILNVADFTCFLQKFAAGDAYANCDGSTVAPVLNVADFTCFLQKFAAGCR